METKIADLLPTEKATRERGLRVGVDGVRARDEFHFEQGNEILVDTGWVDHEGLGFILAFPPGIAGGAVGACQAAPCGGDAKDARLL